ncbi:related to transport protein USO1 [Ustilago trichophora]|uniref:Related to transport protein USO1 n=1 Tax=Ustilago trichophora TaxID=86804 RepID=A0A5C3EM85_9BASI|nr:related to transport protein USO1 [Ustilago trichophora]
MLHGLNILRQQYSQLSKPGGGNQSAINTIQTLADRLLKADENQLSIEDRRAAVLALKGLSRDHNKAVGEHALPALLTSLQRDAKDEDIARALIECCITLCEVQSPDSAQGSGANQGQPQNKRKQQEQGPPPGLQHTDIFLQEPGPLHCLLPLLAPDRAFYTRFASLQLLGSLLRNRPHRVQDHVLVAPGGCGAILECLAEGAGSSAEIVRNEALLLLPHLVYGNADIQKLVAFEGAFEKLLDVCAAEGRIEGGVIVQDALEGLEALLRYNVSNQNYFRETLSIPMLAPLLFYPPGPSNNEFPSKHAEHEYARQLEAFCFQDWDQQKVNNAKIVLDIAGLLIGGQGEGRRANQGALLQCGMTKCLLDLALASTAPASLKAQALHVSASLMQASRANQDLLSTLLVQPVKVVHATKPDAGDGGPEGEHSQDPTYAAAAPVEPSFTRLEPRLASVCLVETAIGTSGAKGGLGLRGAAIACFRSYVADNMDARLAIINGMAPEADDKEDVSPAGKVLLEGIIQSPSTQATAEHADAYKHLVSAMLFSYLLRGSETAKAAARAVAINPDGSIIKHVRAEPEGDDSDDDDDAPSSLIQVIVGNLTLSERELADAVRKERASAMGATVSSTSYSAADWTRIMVGYLVLLSVWLHDSPLSVRDFLSESATLQAVIQPVAQSSGVDPLIQGLAAFLLGVAYEFDTDPGKVAVTRATMHPILQSRIGADQFAVRISRIEDDPRFREVTPDVLEKLILVEEQTEADELRAKQVAEAKAAAAAAAAAQAAAAQASSSDPNAAHNDAKKPEDKTKADEEAQDKDLEVNGLGHLSKRRRAGLWFDWAFVEFWRSNSTLIAKSITVDPTSSSAKEASLPAELLDAQRQVEALRDTVSKQTREIEVLEKRVEELTSSHAAQLSELNTELSAAKEALESHAPQLQAAQTELEQLKSSHAAALAEIQAKHDTLSEQLAQSQAREEEVNGKVLQLTSEMARISTGKPSQKEFAALQKANEELKKKHDDLVASSGGEGGEGKAVGSGAAMKDLLEARELASKRANEIDELQAKITALESAVANAGGSNSNETIFSAGEGNEEVQAKLDAALKEKSELEEKLASNNQQHSSASADLEKANEELTRLKALLEDKEKLETKVQELEKQISTQQQEGESAKGQQAQQVDVLHEEKAALEKKLEALEKVAEEKKELESKLKDLEKVSSEKKELEKKVTNLEKVSKDKAELEKKVKDLDKLNKDKAGLEKKLKDLEKVSSEKKELEKKVKDLDKLAKDKAELEKKVKDLEKVSKDKAELEKKLKALESSSAASSKDLETQLESLETSTKADKEKLERLSKVEAEKAGLEKKLSTLSNLEIEKKELEAKVKTLEAATTSKKNNNVDAKQLDKLKKEKEDIAKENEDLLVLLEELTQKRKKDKAKLREKGEEVSDDEDDDDDDDEE